MDITTDIKYIGVDDTTLDLFESQYHLKQGMCYNSYLILDQKIAVIDTSDQRTVEQWKDNLLAALDGRKPDYLIVQHMEPDHSSGIATFVSLFPDAKIVASAKALQMAQLYFEEIPFANNTIAVKEGQTISLGKHELRFFAAPMVHWPEVIMTYDSTSQSFFSADAFGKFGVLNADPDDWACEARAYYFNICGKYGAPVQQVMKKLSAIDVTRILPLHGPWLEGKKLDEAISLYNIWSSYEPETKGVFIAYASIHGGTKTVALRLADMLRQKGIANISTCDLTRQNQAEAIEDAFKMSHLVCCASSYDAGVFPPMHDFIYHLGIKAYQKRTVAFVENGSWAPCAGRVMREMFTPLKDINIIQPLVTIRGRMQTADIPLLEELATNIANDFKA